MARNTPPSESLGPLLVSPADAAEALGISLWSMHKLIKSGDIASGKYGNRRMVSVASLQEYADVLTGRNTPAGETA